MRAELDEALCRDFPLLYRDQHSDPRTTCMVYGFDCGDGWEPLIRRLSEQLEPLIAAMPEACVCGHPRATHPGPPIVIEEGFSPSYDPKLSCSEYCDQRPGAVQVKEKFGTLRFYIDGQTDEMASLIRVAERASAVTCENCGARGKMRPGGWIQTLCDECVKRRRRGAT